MPRINREAYPSPRSSPYRSAGRQLVRALGRAATSRWGERVIRSIPIVGSAYEGVRMAGDLYNAGRRMFSRGTQTQRAMANASTQAAGKSKRAYGRSAGRWGGKLKPTKKVRGGFKAQAQQKGFSIHFEKGGSITDPYCAYVGHGTCPQVIMRRLLMGCLIKMLLRRMGLSFSTTNQPLTFLTIGDQVQLLVKFDQEAAGVQVVQYTLAANQPSFTTLVDGLVNAWVVTVQGTTFTSPTDWKFVEIRYNPAGTGDLTSVRVPLENAKITFEAQSTLKVQNRSVPAEGDDTTDEVDRIPVTGMIYQCSGAGTNFKRSAIGAIGEVNFEPVGEKQDGIFTYSAGVAGGADVLKEPPLPYNLVRVKKYNKIYVDPGSIKTSVVRIKKTMYLQTLLKQCVGTNEAAASSTVAVQQQLGMFNLVALEKLIETSNVASTQLINLAWEVDYKIFGFINSKMVDNTIGEHYYGTSPN